MKESGGDQSGKFGRCAKRQWTGMISISLPEWSNNYSRFTPCVLTPVVPTQVCRMVADISTLAACLNSNYTHAEV